jgi:hypothetical protein
MKAALREAIASAIGFREALIRSPMISMDSTFVHPHFHPFPSRGGGNRVGDGQDEGQKLFE